VGPPLNLPQKCKTTLYMYACRRPDTHGRKTSRKTSGALINLPLDFINQPRKFSRSQITQLFKRRGTHVLIQQKRPLVLRKLEAALRMSKPTNRETPARFSRPKTYLWKFIDRRSMRDPVEVLVQLHLKGDNGVLQLLGQSGKHSGVVVGLEGVHCLVVVPDKVNRSFNLQTATKRGCEKAAMSKHRSSNLPRANVESLSCE
jgi:hypothetical protein